MPDIPRFFVDSYTSINSPWGVSLSFFRSPSPREVPQAAAGQPVTNVPPAQPVCDMDMSYQHLKIMLIQMRRMLKGYEVDVLKAPIPIDPRIAEQNKITDKDW